MSRRTFLALAILATVGYSEAAAQDAQPDVSVAGRSLRPLVSSEPYDAPWASRELPQQVGLDRTRGALWGGGIGLVAGGLLGGLTVDADDEGGFGGSLTESAATGEAVLFGAVAGAGIGALLGATLLAPSHRSASGDGVGLTLSVHPSGPGVAATGRVRIGR